MATTVPASVTPTPLPMTTTPQVTTGPSKDYNTTLLSIYSAVLVSGVVGICLMVHILHSNMRSITTIAVLNLVFTHLLFLLTIPFRIHYYVVGTWDLGQPLCKAVSAMVHIHMYMSFLFYVIILIMRLLTFYRRGEQMGFYRKLHALAFSAAVWAMVVIVAPCLIIHKYGKMDSENQESSGNSNTSETGCFNFGSRIEKDVVTRVFNYIISSLIIIIACVLTSLQANVLVVLYRKYSRGCTAQQVFWAQLKSLCFALVMLVCFVPYHMFRLYYLSHTALEEVNEVFLSLTSLCCLDMLTFAGRESCHICCRG